MTYITIDPATGLPALPEGQLWRVVETQKAKYEIQLLKLQPDTQKTKTKYEPYHWTAQWIADFWGSDGRAVPYTLTIKKWAVGFCAPRDQDG